MIYKQIQVHERLGLHFNDTAIEAATMLELVLGHCGDRGPIAPGALEARMGLGWVRPPDFI